MVELKAKFSPSATSKLLWRENRRLREENLLLFGKILAQEEKIETLEEASRQKQALIEYANARLEGLYVRYKGVRHG